MWRLVLDGAVMLGGAAAWGLLWGPGGALLREAASCSCFHCCSALLQAKTLTNPRPLHPQQTDNKAIPTPQPQPPTHTHTQPQHTHTHLVAVYPAHPLVDPLQRRHVDGGGPRAVGYVGQVIGVHNAHHMPVGGGGVGVGCACWGQGCLVSGVLRRRNL